MFDISIRTSIYNSLVKYFAMLKVLNLLVDRFGAVSNYQKSGVVIAHTHGPEIK